MKRFTQAFLVLLAAVLSILLAERGARKIYKTWNKGRYTDLMWGKNSQPWE